VRNFYAGVLLLAKEVLVQGSSHRKIIARRSFLLML